MLEFTLMADRFDNKYIQGDKVKHILIGGIIYSACLVTGTVTQKKFFSRENCLMLTALVSISKEVYDFKHPDNHSPEVLDIFSTMSIPIVEYSIYQW